MRTIYHVWLFGEKRGYLEELVRVGKAPARCLMHARILLKADEGGAAWSDDQIVEALEVSRSTVEHHCSRKQRSLVARVLLSIINIGLLFFIGGAHRRP